MHFRDFGGLGANTPKGKSGNFGNGDLQRDFNKFIFFKWRIFYFHDKFIIFFFLKLFNNKMVYNRSTHLRFFVKNRVFSKIPKIPKIGQNRVFVKKRAKNRLF